MKAKTIVLVFGLLLVVGTVMLAVNTWADETYVVVVPLPDEPAVFSKQAVRVMIEMGWLVPEGAEQLATTEGSRCHEVVTWHGNDWYRLCKPGRGIVPCPCPEHNSPSTR